MATAKRIVPFHRPSVGDAEREAAASALSADKKLAAGGPVALACERELERLTGAPRVFLTQSATTALEVSMRLLDVGPGDEVIMPSFCYPSAANAVVLCGGTPVFADVREDTLNVDESLLESARTDRTRAVLVVHYGGGAAAMEEIGAFAGVCGAAVVEDAAHSLGASYHGRALGTFGSFGALSFHETKNLTSGEGGALLVNDTAYFDRAETTLDNGTDRARFLRGEVDAYRWVDVGSSCRPSEVTAAVLGVQLDRLEEINSARLRVWRRYHDAFADLEARGVVRRPAVDDDCAGNGHIYHLLLRDRVARDRAIAGLAEAGIAAAAHYEPLHAAPAARRHARSAGKLRITEDVAGRILRLPLWAGIPEADVEYVIDRAARILT